MKKSAKAPRYPPSSEELTADLVTKPALDPHLYFSD
jgi:hypothetical protein